MVLRINPPDYFPPYGWSYFHMDSPTDKNPPDSGLRINPADVGLRTTSIWIVLRINPADVGLRTGSCWAKLLKKSESMNIGFLFSLTYVSSETESSDFLAADACLFSCRLCPDCSTRLLLGYRRYVGLILWFVG